MALWTAHVARPGTSKRVTLIDRVEASLARVAADEVAVVEPNQTIVATCERHGLNIWDGLAGQELIDEPARVL